MYQSKDESKTSFFYTILIMVLFMIPNYFAIKATIEKELFLTKSSLMQWSEEIEKSIYSNEKDLPRSVKFTFGLYDQNYNKIVSNLPQEPKNFSFETYIKYPYMYYQKNIETNPHNVAYIICATGVNYSSIFMMATLLFLVILVIIYFFNRLMIRHTTIPYKLMQKYMNDFFNDAMHELKTPLGVINVNIELMEKMLKDSRHLRRIQAATKQMQLTYDDIEYYIKNKNIKYSKKKIDISQFLKSRVGFFADVALTKEIEIHTKVKENLFVFMNETELQRVIDNTLSNAIKYSNFKGSIEVELLSKEKGFCFLRVRDYGAGIKNVKSIFDRFKREDNVQGGFGLGLNIVKKICIKNNIHIHIDSHENEGSLFEYKIFLDKVKFLDKAENEID
jgi:two-component system, OmpR family, sensor kinase